MPIHASVPQLLHYQGVQYWPQPHWLQFLKFFSLRSDYAFGETGVVNQLNLALAWFEEPVSPFGSVKSAFSSKAASSRKWESFSSYLSEDHVLALR